MDTSKPYQERRERRPRRDGDRRGGGFNRGGQGGGFNRGGQGGGFNRGGQGGFNRNNNNSRPNGGFNRGPAPTASSAAPAAPAKEGGAN